MANYNTHFAFKFTATRRDAERLIEVIRCAAAIDESKPLLLGADIEAAFRAPGRSPEEVFAAITDDMGLGFDCLLSASEQSLTVFDTDGAPNLWALANCLHRLFPDKLPLGFVYSESCDKARADGFGGGYFVITDEGVSNESLAHILDRALTKARASDHD